MTSSLSELQIPELIRSVNSEYYLFNTNTPTPPIDPAPFDGNLSTYSYVVKMSIKKIWIELVQSLTREGVIFSYIDSRPSLTCRLPPIDDMSNYDSELNFVTNIYKISSDKYVVDFRYMGGCRFTFKDIIQNITSKFNLSSP